MVFVRAALSDCECEKSEIQYSNKKWDINIQINTHGARA